SSKPPVAVLVVIATAVFAGLMLWNTRFPHVTGERSGATPVVRWPAPPSVRRIALSTAAVVVLLVIATVLSLSYPDAGWFALFYYASTGASTIRSTQVAV